MKKAQQLLAGASGVTVLTGAGVSAESGIPTFRGAGGLWRNFRATDLATPAAFARDPKLVWEWYDWRRGLVAAAEPNPAHRALAAWQDRFPRFTLITQNVDGLHERAGSRDVLRLHGSLWRTRCTNCGVEAENHEVPLAKIPPHCACGGLLRPAIVWFGEGLDEAVWHNAEQAARNAQVFLVAGTSAVVYPAASLVPLAKRAGAAVIEINAEETPATELADDSIRGSAGEILPQLLP